METIQNAAKPTVELTHDRFCVSCKTCNVSKAYLTPQGVNAFKLEHAEHKVIEDRLDIFGPVEHDVIVRRQAPPPPQQQQEQPLVEEPAPQQQEQPLVEEPAPPQQQEQPLVEEPAPPPLQQQQQQPHLEQQAEVLLPQLTQPDVQLNGIVAADAPPTLSEKDLNESLLLAMSSYIEEGDEKRSEALKVSRVLKEFRWNVEPPYVIGIMIDDNLSIETNVGVISRNVLNRIEQLGYAFVAINAPQGSPVAWFKKKVADMEMIPHGSDAAMTMQMKQGRRAYDKSKAVWEQSFLSLLMAVRDMDGEKLKRVTDMIRSADSPESDLRS